MKYIEQNRQTKISTSEITRSPDTKVATSTPQGTPSAVPRSRCHPLVRVSPQVLVPAKITNAAITAQYQRDGDTTSPTTIANEAATATWMACRVVGRSPGPPDPPAGAGGGAVSPTPVSAVAPLTSARTSAVARAVAMMATA